MYINSRSFKYANTTILAKGPAYFRRVSFELPLHFVLCLELFSSSEPSVNSWRVTGGYVYFRVGKHETTPIIAALWLGRKKQRFSGTNQKPELLRPFGTGPSKPCPQGSPGAFTLLLDFSSPEFFLARLDFSPPPLTAPRSPRMLKHFLRTRIDDAWPLIEFNYSFWKTKVSSYLCN